MTPPRIDLNGVKLPAENKGRLLLQIPGERPFSLYESDLSEAAKKQLKKLDKAAQDIEGIFAKKLLNELASKTIGGEGQMGDYVREQFLDSMSNQISKTNGLGLAKMLRQKLSENIYRQEAARSMLGTPDLDQNK